MNNNQLTAFVNDLGQAAALVSCYCNIHISSATNYPPR
jgi:hypothetical protein